MRGSLFTAYSPWDSLNRMCSLSMTLVSRILRVLMQLFDSPVASNESLNAASRFSARVSSLGEALAIAIPIS